MNYRDKIKPSEFIIPSKGLVEEGEGTLWITVEGYNLLAEILAQHNSKSVVGK